MLEYCKIQEGSELRNIRIQKKMPIYFLFFSE